MGLINNIKDAFNKAEFTVAPNKKLETISADFLKAFDLQLAFYKGQKLADPEMTLAALNSRTSKEVNDKDKDLIRKSLKLYGPTAVLKDKTVASSDFWDNKTYNATFELKYLDRDDAKKEVSAAGIRL